jgi:hypothetical protein
MNNEQPECVYCIGERISLSDGKLARGYGMVPSLQKNQGKAASFVTSYRFRTK